MEFPKVLLLSFSGLGSQNATGQLIATLFHNCPRDRLLQIYWGHHPEPSIQGLDAAKVDKHEILRTINAYQPEVIYLRPADNHIDYARLTFGICQQLKIPMVLHMMDDWPARKDEQEHGTELVEMLIHAMDSADTKITICDEMSREYHQRYGGEFTHLANGVDSELWSNLKPRRNSQFTIRYCGALAEDMQQQSVLDFGEAVIELVEAGKAIHLEIYTMPWFQAIAQLLADRCENISVHDLVPVDEYPQLLVDADALLLAYNFDSRSMSYTKLSFANKTPECLASGTPVLAYGPAHIPSIRHIASNEIGYTVVTPEADKLKNTLSQMIEDRGTADSIADKARKFTLKHNNINEIRRRFKSLVQQAAESTRMIRLKEFKRDDDVVVDETLVLYQYFSSRQGCANPTMIDVGAHHGSAFKSFLEDGWSVHAFEPDPNNHEYIAERMLDKPGLTLSHLAVGNESGKRLSFYASEQSTGISSLIPFQKDHKEVTQVSTIRLDDYISDKGIDSVDFLKIDTEGFDLRVLQGFPWDKINPTVIECEFEDAKTQKIGYDLHEQAQFLLDQGYSVFVSEWHPIVRYGIRHQWRQLNQYPTKNIGSTSWGNFLAFKEPMTLEQLEAHFLVVMGEKNPGKSLMKTDQPKTPAIAQHKSPRARAQPPNTHRGSIVNHVQIFTNFLGSRSGKIVVLLLALASVGMTMALLTSTNVIALPLWARILTAGVGLTALIHAFAYQAERTRHERRQDQSDQAVTDLTTRTQELRAQLESVTEQLAETELKLQRTQAQNLDIKRKLPEIIQMINNTSSEFDNQ